MADLAGRPGPGPSPRTTPSPPAQTLFDGVWAEFSPNGRYLAYKSMAGEPGRSEVYVRPFPQVDSGRSQISTTGGKPPRVGAERPRAVLPRCIEYADRGAGSDIRIDVSRGQAGEGVRRQVLDTTSTRPYDVSADGNRFLMLKDSGAGDPNATPISMVVVEHWFEELRKRVTGK